jgi:hypothetical protein
VGPLTGTGAEGRLARLAVGALTGWALSELAQSATAWFSCLAVPLVHWFLERRRRDDRAQERAADRALLAPPSTRGPDCGPTSTGWPGWPWPHHGQRPGPPLLCRDSTSPVRTRSCQRNDSQAVDHGELDGGRPGRDQQAGTAQPLEHRVGR